MAIIRCSAVLRHVSGLARDNVVNSFHFEGDPEDAAVLQAIHDQVVTFYFGDVPATGVSVAYFLSQSLTTIDTHQYVIPGTITDGKETPAGPPVKSVLGGAGALSNITKGSAVNLPQEVAVCVSYQGTPESGLVQRRRRGRIYVGPLNGVANASTGGTIARPSALCRDTFAKAMLRLLEDVDTEAEAVVYSRPHPGRAAIARVDRPDLPAIAARTGSTVNIDEVWCDDEFDTQRRRGLQRTGRTLYTPTEPNP